MPEAQSMMIILLLLVWATTNVCRGQQATLSQPLSESRFNLAAAGAGNKILFGGGSYVLFLSFFAPLLLNFCLSNYCSSATGFSSVVDIYDTTTNTWSITALSQAREYPAAAGAGTKILFGGGLYADSI